MQAITIARLVLPLVTATSLALAGCGGEDSTTTQAPAGQQRGFGLTAAQQSCLQQCLDFPQGGGAPPPGGGARPQLTAEQRAQFEKRRHEMAAAFEKCGIDLPAGGPGGGAPPGATA